MGATERKLLQLGEVRGVVAGNWGEVSSSASAATDFVEPCVSYIHFQLTKQLEIENLFPPSAVLS